MRFTAAQQFNGHRVWCLTFHPVNHLTRAPLAHGLHNQCHGRSLSSRLTKEKKIPRTHTPHKPNSPPKTLKKKTNRKKIRKDIKIGLIQWPSKVFCDWFEYLQTNRGRSKRSKMSLWEARVQLGGLVHIHVLFTCLKELFYLWFMSGSDAGGSLLPDPSSKMHPSTIQSGEQRADCYFTLASGKDGFALSILPHTQTWSHSFHRAECTLCMWCD